MSDTQEEGKTMAFNRGAALAAGNERLPAFEKELHDRSLGGHWEMLWVEELEPFRWEWAHILDALERATDILDIGRADDPNDRRTVHLVNPALSDLRRTTRTIQVAIQLVLPGETGEAHRHTQNAMRFVADTAGDMYTTVNGEKMLMGPGDLVLTPNWSWHDHNNASSSKAVWLDILDVNMTIDVGAHFKDTWTEGALQPVIREDGYTEQRTRAVRPRTVETPTGAVPYAYRWSDTSATLKAMHEDGQIDPHEGVCVEFAHPLTGGPTFSSMQCRMHMIPPGSETTPIRRTGVTFYHAFRGSGLTTVGHGEHNPDRRTPSRAAAEQILEWGESDCLMVPSWRWQSHRNESDEPAFLFSVTDAPTLQALGWYREQRA